MRILLAVVLGLMASLCRGQGESAKWQAKAAELKGLSESEFRSAVRAMTRPPHARGEFGSVGGAVYRASWSGCVSQVDEDWWIVREAAEPTNVGPPPAGVTISVSVVGIADLKSKIDPGLYEAVRVIHRSPGISAFGFDPVNLIRAVNYLQGLGEAKAVAALEEYSRVCETNQGMVWHQLDSERVILIARLLWEAPKGGAAIREPMLGGPVITLTRGSASEALFPLAVRDDVPFLVDWGYALAGHAEEAMSYVRECRAKGVFRKKPMSPGKDPVSAGEGVIGVVVKDLQATYNTSYQKETVVDQVRRQAVQATGATDPESVSDGDWERAGVGAKGLKWDGVKGEWGK